MVSAITVTAHFTEDRHRMSACQTVVSVTEPSGIGEARRQISRIAEDAGFSEADCGKAAIIASELATNLSRYAQGGEMLLRSAVAGDSKWIEIVSIDRGPGIADVGRCLEDGFSTGGTSGTGLGASRRLATEFDIYSGEPTGTVVFCRLSDKPASPVRRQAFSWGVINRPAPHEIVCGDSWSIAERSGELAIILVDGLGHGPEAAAAAAEATLVFDRDPFAPLSTIIESAHLRMRTTRGGAIAAAQIDVEARVMKYVGVGNISGRLRGDNGQAGRGLFTHNGTVGVQMRKVQHFEYECPARGLLVMHSDGLQSRWSLDSYPGLLQRHPAVIAGVLYRDFTRGRDDVTVAVVKLELE